MPPTIDELSTALVNAHNAGDVPAAQALAAEIQKMQAQPAPGLLQQGYDTLKSGAQAVVGGINKVTPYLSIPQGEIKNPQGDVVFPTNALERGLQASAGPTNEAAVAFSGSPGFKPRLSAAQVRGAATDVYNNPANRRSLVLPGDVAQSVTDFQAARPGYHPDLYPSVAVVADEMAANKGLTSVDKLDRWSTMLGNIAKDQAAKKAPGVKGYTSEQAAALDLKGRIDNMITGAVPEWATADKNYAAAEMANNLSKRENIETIRSEGRGQPYAERMQNAATQLRLDPRTQATLSPAQDRMLGDLQRGTPVVDWLHKQWTQTPIAGPAIGGALGFAKGGPAGLAAGAGIGVGVNAAENLAVNFLRNRMATQKADALIQAILNDSPAAQSMYGGASKQAIARALLYASSKAPLRADENQ